ncbi:RNA recognition motif protein 1 [Dorcoceras hygrometricum]|uniref:RNA recognition motif protein 1 n=1 Tax=Dorcoceras hygrometricum TaxID=472368 RepID=A0A2Z7CGT2_9LAMI|nr:RNA recognition motif protein 1 [Dorcoceras hygrometricum]
MRLRNKKTPPGPGHKRAARPSLTTSVNVRSLTDESNVKAEEEAEEGVPLMAAQEKVMEFEEKAKSAESGYISPKNDVDTRELVGEYEKEERIDFEDTDPGYEAEEYGSVDYDEKEIDLNQTDGDGDKLEEELDEGDIGEDEEDDVEEEELEDVTEEHEEEDEHVGEEHTEMINVAEEEEHHELVKERRKRKEFEIFVGGLDKDATEKDLREVFSEVGDVTEVRLLMNPQTKKNKGFAFLRFATVEQAKRACAQLKNPVVNGKQCGVTPSQDSDTLFLGNVCRTWTKAALKEKLKHYGVENIEDLTLVEDSNNVGMNRGFAFLEFSSRADAMDAFKLLQKRDVVFGVDRPAKVSFADSFIDPGDEIMAQVKTVFIDGLSATWDEDHVKELLKIYGKIEKVELARNMPSARRKDFGFVTFDTHDAAVTCAKSINNEDLGEGNNKAKVRARLSRPLQRGKGKHVARGDSRPVRRSIRGVRGSWGPAPRSLPHNSRGSGPRLPPMVNRGFTRPGGIRERKPVMAVPPRSRPMPPLPRSYDRRPPVPPYPKGGLKRDYPHRVEIPPRSRAPLDYSSRVSSDRRPLYKNDYPPHGSGYPDVPRGGASHSVRKAYIDDGYSQRYERPPPVYREVRGREYDPMSGSKRSYASMDEVPSRYSETGVRHSRARLDYDTAGSVPHYGDAYGDRLGRSNLGYGGSRSSLSGHDSHVLYGDRQGSYGGRDVGGMYSSNFGGGYISRGNDVGGSSYSSLYSGRGLGGNSYTGSGGSGSYY